MQENELNEIVVSSKEEGVRLDKLLAARFVDTAYSRTYFQHLIETQAVLVNGCPAKKRIKPQVGDEIEIYFSLLPELTLKAEDIPLTIVYEDEDILIINKPPGMVVHPAPGHWSGTFVNALLFHCQHLKNELANSHRPGIVHRLDKETSGLLIAAKHLSAQQKLIEMFAARQIYKEYIAVCVGNPGEIEIKAPIGRHPVHRKKMCIREDGGRLAISRCKPVAFDGKLSVVHVILETGRTHQIRVHMLHRGTPVLGDSLYGNSAVNQRFMTCRQLLHASHLKFKHPTQDKWMDVVASLPEDMQVMVEKIKIKNIF